VVLIRAATPADADAIVAVRRVSWLAAYDGIVAPEVIEQALAPADAARLRTRFTDQPWRHTLVAEHQPAPAPDPAAAPVSVITGYASYGIERGVDGDPKPPHADAASGSRPPVAELYALYVAPDHWSTGTGRALMDQVLAEVRAARYPRIILWVLRDNYRARRFYERAGFRRRGQEHPSFVGPPEVRYARDL
jgi:ribosomal protein S18 acetylase RimI-like enzyme